MRTSRVLKASSPFLVLPHVKNFPRMHIRIYDIRIRNCENSTFTHLSDTILLWVLSSHEVCHDVSLDEIEKNTRLLGGDRNSHLGLSSALVRRRKSIADGPTIPCFLFCEPLGE